MYSFILGLLLILNNANTDDERKSHSIIPKHIAFVMDGNRRWEKEQLKRLKGKGINKGEEDNDIKNESKKMIKGTKEVPKPYKTSSGGP